MTNTVFVRVLHEMADVEREADRHEMAEALEEFGELFDGDDERRLDTIVEQIRAARKLIAA